MNEAARPESREGPTAGQSTELSTPPSTRPAQPRIRSIDALRGFDMVMILGGREVILALTLALGLGGLHGTLEHQLEHPEWHGFTAWDVAFPLFLFLAGASLPFSFAAREARGETKKHLAAHTIRRAVVLVLLGAIYNGALALEPERLRVASVLGRIGLAWAGAALIVLAFRLRGQVAAFVGLLLLHSALLLLVPMPGLDQVSLEPGQTISGWVDRHLVPGRLYKVDRDPEGLFGVIPAIGTALLGSFAGRWLARDGITHGRRIGGLLLAGSQCILVGTLLDRAGLPVNKNLWTASFVLVAGGWSLAALAVAHALFDVLGARRLALAFTVVGANAILAYVTAAFVDWRDPVEVLLARGIERGKLHVAWVPVLGLTLQWALLYVLYRRRIFLRV